MIRITSILCLLFSLNAKAQYFYKDLVTARQTMEKKASYKSQKVQSVNVISYENNGQPTEDFAGRQAVSGNYTRIITTLKTPLNGESELTTFFDGNGRLTKTVDTTDGSYSESQYFYNTNNAITKIMNISRSSGGRTESEDHLWTYNNSGQPQSMLRIKNGSDTTYVTFGLDDKGNVAEENSMRRNRQLPAYYYYYDDKNRLTDVVTYSEKARRLLPLYVFEYNNNDQITSMLVVPEGSDDYQKWLYEYNAAGLKTKETALNKHKQVLGRIEYQYR